MADIKDMTREEIEQYLASMPKDVTVPSAKQETTAAETMRGADGTYDVSKVSLSKMFADKANERGYTDDETGEKKSYNKGSKWQAYIDKNITDPAAKADMEQQIHAVVSANPNMSPKELKYRLRAVEANLRRKYPNGVSKNFDISGGMFDSTMAKDLLALGLKSGNKPTETKQPDTATPPAAETPKETQKPVAQKPVIQKPAVQKSPTTNDELNAAFKRIKNKQASDADLALFNKYSEEQLKKIGFGPISIAAIKGTTKPVQTAKSDSISDDDVVFMNKYKQYAEQLSGAQPRSSEALKQMQESEAYKFITNPANKNRYQNILKKRNSAKKTDGDKAPKKTFRQAVKGNML